MNERIYLPHSLSQLVAVDHSLILLYGRMTGGSTDVFLSLYVSAQFLALQVYSEVLLLLYTNLFCTENNPTQMRARKMENNSCPTFKITIAIDYMSILSLLKVFPHPCMSQSVGPSHTHQIKQLSEKNSSKSACIIHSYKFRVLRLVNLSKCHLTKKKKIRVFLLVCLFCQCAVRKSHGSFN